MLSQRDKKGHEERIIKVLRKVLKKMPIAKRICDKYNEDDDFMDKIPISFKPLDVSAKTVNGHIILNSKLLEGEFRDNIRYLIHELTHCLQQEHGLVSDNDEGDYLDDPNEVEAFWNQINSMKNMYDPEEIQEYIDGLMDHHDIKGEDREEKVEELTSKKEPEKKSK
jgi:hypothetical protein